MYFLQQTGSEVDLVHPGLVEARPHSFNESGQCNDIHNNYKYQYPDVESEYKSLMYIDVSCSPVWKALMTNVSFIFIKS